MTNIRNTAQELFKQGYSCSEALIRACYEEGIILKSTDIKLLTSIATPFSGGLGDKCLCGAISGAQMAMGVIFGRKTLSDSPIAKKLAGEFMREFKKKYPATCCRVLSKKYDFASAERRENCANIVGDCAEIIEVLVKKNLQAVES